jgi:hypothetical protein
MIATGLRATMIMMVNKKADIGEVNANIRKAKGDPCGNIFYRILMENLFGLLN